MRFLSSSFLVGAVALAACNSGTGTDPVMPSVPVNVQLDLLDQQNKALRLDYGVLAIPPGTANGHGGIKGIYVVHQSGTRYLAFERNCPYKPLDACATVTLDRNSHLFFRDSCCTSQFDLEGNLQNGPSARPLRQYTTSLNGSLLTITN